MTKNLLEEYENFKKTGYWKKLCLLCTNHEIIVHAGYKTDLYFWCKYLHENIMSVNLYTDWKGKSCLGWSWVGNDDKLEKALGHRS
jgi:hypothetical protein